jgi:hypothetical protein
VKARVYRYFLDRAEWVAVTQPMEFKDAQVKLVTLQVSYPDNQYTVM